jgi:MFS family permease
MNIKAYLNSMAPSELPPQAKSFLIGDTLNGLGNGILNVVLQLYFISIGFDGLTLGTASMLQAIGQALFTLPSGYLADRFGKRKMVVIGFAFGLSFLLWLVSTSTWVILIGFFLLGICNAIIGVVLFPLYASFYKQRDMDKAFGFRGFINIIARSVGSLVGFIPPILVTNFGYNLQTAYWNTLIFATAIIFAQMPFYFSSTKDIVEIKKGGKFDFNLKSRKIVSKFAFITIITSIGFGIFFNLFPFYVNKKFGIASDSLGILYFISNFLQAGASIIAPKISEKIGSLNAIVSSIGICIPFWLMFTAASSYPILAILYCFRLFFSSLADPLANSLYMKLIDQDERSTAFSISMMASMSGAIIGPRLGGVLMEKVSLDYPVYIGSALYLLATVSYLILLRNEKPM